MYFILRTVHEQGRYENLLLGEWYEMMYFKDYEPTEYENKPYAQIIYEDGITTLHETESYYVMTSVGDTFEKIKL